MEKCAKAIEKNCKVLQGKYISYLFSILKFLMMAVTVKRLRFGWTLWPASLMLKPWFSTWSTTAAQISFFCLFLLLLLLRVLLILLLVILFLLLVLLLLLPLVPVLLVLLFLPQSIFVAT